RINEKNIGEPPSPNRCSTDINFSSSKGERFPPNKANLSLKAGSSLTDGKHQLPFRDDAIADPGDALSFPHRSFQTEKFHFQTEDIPRAHLSAETKFVNTGKKSQLPAVFLHPQHCHRPHLGQRL